VTKVRKRVFDSTTTTSLIRPWQRRIGDSSIRPRTPLRFYYDEVKVETLRFLHGYPSDSVMTMPCRKVFDSFAAISSIKLKERAIRPRLVGSRLNRPNGRREIPYVPLLSLAKWKKRGSSPPSTRFDRVDREGNPLPLLRLTMDREQNPLPLLELTEWEERGIPPPSTRFNRVKEEGNPSLYSISNERVGGMGFGRR